MTKAYTEAFTNEQDSPERVTIIRAERFSFCAGQTLSSKDIHRSAEKMVVQMFDAVQLYSIPVVAQVHGAAFAGGYELALQCDFVIADKNALFGMPLTQLGVTTNWFRTKGIMETMGLIAAWDLLLLGDPIPAQNFMNAASSLALLLTESLRSRRIKLSNVLLPTHHCRCLSSKDFYWSKLQFTTTLGIPNKILR